MQASAVATPVPSVRGTILVVDDEPQILKAVSHRLEQEGYVVATAADGEEALTAYREQHPDMVVLDLMLPKVDGFEVCRMLRASSDVPIMVLSAKDDELDKVVGFRLGVDDYMTKPFSPSELALRVRAILRRTIANGAAEQGPVEVLRFGTLLIDRKRHAVEVGNRPVLLTPKEFELLWLMASHPGYVYTRDQLLYQLWETEFGTDPSNVTVLVSRLREKLENNPSDPEYVKTVWGVGYKFSPGEATHTHTAVS